jgi:hypothetical protein
VAAGGNRRTQRAGAARSAAASRRTATLSEAANRLALRRISIPLPTHHRPAIDLNLWPTWEANFRVGVGVTHSTERLVAKIILGYRFDF